MAIKPGTYLRNGSTLRLVGQENYFGLLFIEFSPSQDADEGNEAASKLEQWGKPIDEAEARALIPDMDEQLAGEG